MLFSELSTAVFFCLVIVVHESLVCPEQLNCLLFLQKKPSNYLVLQHFCVFDLFPPMTMILRYIFSHWGQRRDRYATITEGSNSHRCPRRKNHTLRARGENFWTEWRCTFFLVCLNIIFLFSNALQRIQKIVTCFPEDKISKMYPDHQIQKVFTPWLLMVFRSGTSVIVLTMCNFTLSSILLKQTKHLHDEV